MLARLREYFGAGTSAGNQSYRRRVNIQRRFTVVDEASSQGSMSRVFRAIDQESGRTICLKIQNREKNAAAMARASHHQARPPEGEIARKIHHENVVRTLEYGETNHGEHYLVMEFIHGVSFQCARETRMCRTVQKVEWLAQAAEGLAAVHQAGYIHHDINPRNFRIDRNNVAKLIDFGLSIPNTEYFRRPGNRTGTLQYMAPELIRREPIDERIDIFGFGVLAFEFLTDRLPYEGANSASIMLQRLNTEPLDAIKIKPKLSDEMGEVLRRLIARRAEDRWPSMSTVASTLRSIPPKRRRP